MLRRFDKYLQSNQIFKSPDSIFKGFDVIAKNIIYIIQGNIEQHKRIKIDNFYNYDLSVKSLSIGLKNAFQMNSLCYQDYEHFTDTDKINFHRMISKHLIQRYNLDNMLVSMNNQNALAQYFLLYVSDRSGHRSNQSSVQGRIILSHDMKDAVYSFLIYKNANKQMFAFFKGCSDTNSILNQKLPKELQSLMANQFVKLCINDLNDKQLSVNLK